MIATNIIMIVVMLAMAGAVGYLIYKTIGGIEEGADDTTMELDKNNFKNMSYRDNHYEMSETTKELQLKTQAAYNEYDSRKALEETPTTFWTLIFNRELTSAKIANAIQGGSDAAKGKITYYEDAYESAKSQDQVFMASRDAAGDHSSITNFNFNELVPFIVGFVLLLFILALAAILKPRSKKEKSIENREDIQDATYREVTPEPQAAPQPIVVEAPTRPAIDVLPSTATNYRIDADRAKTKALALCDSQHITYDTAVAEAGTDDPQKVYQYMLGR